MDLNGAATIGPQRDGRHERSDRTRAALLVACRELMTGGAFRPPMTAICERAECSSRSGFLHFTNVETLLLAAIDDIDTHDAILNQMLADHAYDCSPEAERAIVRAAVLGRVP